MKNSRKRERTTQRGEHLQEGRDRSSEGGGSLGYHPTGGDSSSQGKKGGLMTMEQRTKQKIQNLIKKRRKNNLIMKSNASL